jgi:hypothetical protein
MSELHDLEQFVYHFVHDLETLNASIEYLLQKGNEEHEQLMRDIEQIRSSRDAYSDVVRRNQ